MRRQMRRSGWPTTGRGSIATTDVDYYRWTQWIFLQIFNCVRRAGRARPVRSPSWRPSSTPAAARAPTAALGGLDRSSGARTSTPTGSPTSPRRRSTGARNWDGPRQRGGIVDGRASVGGYPVFERRSAQWMLRITAYADRLLSGLDGVDWPDSTKRMQRTGSAGARAPR